MDRKNKSLNELLQNINSKYFSRESRGEYNGLDYLYVDGSTKLNAICIYDYWRDKKVVKGFKGGLTNNDLEWYAVLLAVRYYNRTRRRKGVEDNYIILSDSQLVTNQLRGDWKCNIDRFIEMMEFVNAEVGFGKEYKNNVFGGINWIPRDDNFAGKILDIMINRVKKRGKRGDGK